MHRVVCFKLDPREGRNDVCGDRASPERIVAEIAVVIPVEEPATEHGPIGERHESDQGERRYQPLATCFRSGHGRRFEPSRPSFRQKTQLTHEAAGDNIAGLYSLMATLRDERPRARRVSAPRP